MEAVQHLPQTLLLNTSYVHPDTKARILAAVKELSYQPNVLAKGLRQGKRHTIGIVVPRLSMTVFAELIQGIDEEARYHGYSILVCTTDVGRILRTFKIKKNVEVTDNGKIII